MLHNIKKTKQEHDYILLNKLKMCCITQTSEEVSLQHLQGGGRFISAEEQTLQLRILFLLLVEIKKKKPANYRVRGHHLLVKNA